LGDVPDYPNALNGLQVECDREITHVAAAVDTSTRTIRGALDAGASMLIVHHGLFWGGLQRIRGPHYRRIRALLEGHIALYSAHLPLDSHADIGNNVLLARELELEPTAGFARYKGSDIGVSGVTDVSMSELFARVDGFARRYGGSARHTGLRPHQRTHRWAICTGAGASADTLREAVDSDIDTLIVGEGAHWTAVDSPEAGVTIMYAGHYATETLGVQALAQSVATRFDMPWTFVHAPTGM
jgi:dinuclear metal center YbgI/SA1388 family protein